MKCHYIYDQDAGKVLIPGCWSVVNTGDMRWCTCRVNRPPSNERDDLIKELEQENAQLNRIIKRLLKAK